MLLNRNSPSFAARREHIHIRQPKLRATKEFVMRVYRSTAQWICRSGSMLRSSIVTCLVVSWTCMVTSCTSQTNSPTSDPDQWKTHIQFGDGEASAAKRILKSRGNVFAQVTSVVVVGPVDFSDLPQLTKLESLSVFPNVSDSDVEDIALQDNLRALHLHRCQALTPQGMDAISRLSHLEELELTKLTLGDEDLAGLKSLQALRVLKIVSAPNVTGKLIDYLPPEIEHIEFFACPRVDDSFASNLPRFSKLRTLSLQGTSISDDSIPALLKIPSLTSLTIAETRISPAGARTLRTQLKASVWTDITQRVGSSQSKGPNTNRKSSPGRSF